MDFAPRLERKRAFRVTGGHEAPKKPRHASENHLGFATRIFTLFFKRRLFAEISQPKWFGRSNATSVENTTRHSSVQRMIVSGFGLTALEISSRYAADDKKSDSDWRQRQTQCVNCGRLFFKSLSTLHPDTGRFCSLDCRSTFEYVDRLERLIAGHMLGGSICSNSSSNEDDYAIEEHDVDELLADLQTEYTSH